MKPLIFRIRSGNKIWEKNMRSTGLSSLTFINSTNLEVSYNRATPSSHPFIDPIFHEINHPTIGWYPPWLWKPPIVQASRHDEEQARGALQTAETQVGQGGEGTLEEFSWWTSNDGKIKVYNVYIMCIKCVYNVYVYIYKVYIYIMCIYIMYIM